jgi:WD40 repeat protein
MRFTIHSLMASLALVLCCREADQAKVPPPEPRAITALAFTPDGRYGLSGDGFGVLRLLDLGKETADERWTPDLSLRPKGRGDSKPRGIRAVAVSADGQWALSAQGVYIHVWDLETRKEVALLVGHEEKGVLCACFSPDGALIASGGRDQTLRLWDRKTGKELRSITGQEGEVKAVAFSPDGRSLLAAGGGAIVLWSVEGGRELRRIKPGGSINGLAFLPSGRYFLTGGYDRQEQEWDVQVWEAATGKAVLRLKKHRQTIFSLACSSDGKAALSCGEGELYLWDLTSGKFVHAFDAAGVDAGAVAISPDGGQALVGVDGRETLLDLAERKVVHQFKRW